MSRGRKGIYSAIFAAQVLMSSFAASAANIWDSWGQDKKISCEELTSDWPLWSALSKQPWTPQEIAARHYSNSADPAGVIGEDTQGAFRGHGADTGLFYSDASLEIVSHMLVAPTKAVCGDALGEKLRVSVDTLAHGYAPFRNSQKYSELSEQEFQNAADFDAADPVIVGFDIVEFGRFRLSMLPGDADAETNQADKVRNFAWKRWRSDHNPLWYVAILENSRDPQDLTDVSEAVSALRQWPDLSPAGQARFAWRLAAQYARLQLVAGRLDEAAAARRFINSADFARLHDPGVHPDVLAAADTIVNQGLRLFLTRHDRQSARRWALVASKAFETAVSDRIKPLLVDRFDELYGDTALALNRSKGPGELGPGRALLDTFAASTIIEFSRLPGVSTDDRRAMVGAAWARAYALGRQSDLVAWLPDLRGAFPELAEDVRQIEAADGEARRQRLLTHLLLKAPGLVALPSWARPPGGPVRFSAIAKDRPAGVLAFDSENGNDGNWWCEPDLDVIRVNSAEILIDTALSEYDFISASPFPRSYEAADEPKRLKHLATADQAFALYPVLGRIDSKELALFARSGSAVKRLAEEAMRWADEYRRGGASLADDGELLAETLHLAVKATRHGCHKGDNASLSKRAYTALHQLFPNSPWAKLTPHWFGAQTPQALP
jgi:hypothetical protein